MLPAGNVIFVASQEAADEAGPDFGETIEKVQGNLTLEVMQELNARVDIDKEKPEQAAQRVPAGVRLHRVARFGSARRPRGRTGPVGAAAILDVDGTLVDSNYQHAIAWYRAFREHDLAPAVWRIHRHIGVGGDQLVARVAGDEVEARARRRDPRGRGAPVRRADRRGAARSRAPAS